MKSKQKRIELVTRPAVLDVVHHPQVLYGLVLFGGGKAVNQRHLIPQVKERQTSRVAGKIYVLGLTTYRLRYEYAYRHRRKK